MLLMAVTDCHRLSVCRSVLTSPSCGMSSSVGTGTLQDEQASECPPVRCLGGIRLTDRVINSRRRRRRCPCACRVVVYFVRFLLIITNHDDSDDVGALCHLQQQRQRQARYDCTVRGWASERAGTERSRDF